MGIEAFGVTMQFAPGVYGAVKELLQATPNIHVLNSEETKSYESVYCEYTDDSHFVEFQLSRDKANDRASLAVRFSLCSYESIDSIFIDQVRTILSSFEAEVWLMNSALKQKEHYLPGDSNWLLALLKEEIVEMRHYWQNLFGSKQGVVRVKDSFAFVGAEAR